MIISQRLKARRLQLGLSAEDVAKFLGVSRATIYRYESADIENMGIDKIEPLAKILKTTPAYLMGWTAVSETQDYVAGLTPHERKLVLEYRRQPQSRYAVDKLLGIAEDAEEIEQMLKVMEAKRENRFSTAAVGGNNLNQPAQENVEAIERILKKR